jgi:hypothetical protein
MDKIKMLAGGAVGAIVGLITTLAAHAQSVPTVGTSDIATVGGAMLSPVISGSEYTLQTFGPPLFMLLLVFAVFFAIYHRVKVGHWL